MKQEELQLHIEKLHDYNEMKDVGQMLLGRIGEKILFYTPLINMFLEDFSFTFIFADFF